MSHHHGRCLCRINIGSNGNVTNLFNITDNGSTLFSVSESQITSAIPHQFTSAGDVSFSYDAVFTNQTASQIESYGPFTINVGDTYESNNLILRTYNAGNILLDIGSGGVGIGTGVTPTAILEVSGAKTGKFWLFSNETGDQNNLTASASGTTVFTLARTGNLTTTAGYGLDTLAAGELRLGDVTATTVSLGTTAAATLNLGAGGSLARGINIGTGTGIDTINIGTGGTGADVITIGGGVGTLAINTGDWDISVAGDLTGIGSITMDGRLDTAAHDNNTGLNLPTFAGAPSAVTGTAEGDVVYDTTGDALYVYDGGAFTQIGGGGYSGWTLTGDTGSESVGSGNTVLVAGGTNGIDTAVTATDTVTLNLDYTEITTATFGTGAAGWTWTFNTGTTDPFFTFADNALTLGGAATVTATDVTAFNCTDCLNFDDFSDSLTLDASTSIGFGAGALNLTFTNDGSGNEIHNLTSTGDFIIQDNSNNLAVFGDDSVITLTPANTTTAAGRLYVDGATVDSTATAGLVDIDVDTLTSTAKGLSIDFQVLDAAGNLTVYGQRTDVTVDTDAAQSHTVYGNYIGLTANDASSTTYGLAVIAEDAGAQIATAGILVENLQATDIDLTDGILIRATTADSIVDGLDVSDAEITNAVNVGNNFLVGDGIRLFASASTV